MNGNANGTDVVTLVENSSNQAKSEVVAQFIQEQKVLLTEAHFLELL